jgi:serine/threonine protein kinase
VEIVGTVLEDKYRVLRQIGEGGMGAVYEAEHAFIGKRVAVKVLLPEYARNREAVRRFHREALAVSRIGHVNIVDITDMGLTAAGAPYIVMEFLKGEPLSAVLRRDGPFPVRRAADILGQTLAALGAAHEAGIVHRDIKPQNLFLINLGGRADFIKVLDFGISKMRVARGSRGSPCRGRRWGRPSTCPPSRQPVVRISITASMCTPPAPCCSRCSWDARRTRAQTTTRSSPGSSRPTRRRSARSGPRSIRRSNGSSGRR